MENSLVYRYSSLNSEENSELLASLLSRSQAGDEEGFGSIYNLFFEKIYRFIYYRVSHKEVAEDLTEDVFIKAFQKIGSIHDNKSFESWLYQIARNKVIDYYREKKITVALDEVENILQYDSNILDILHLSQQQGVLLGLLKELSAQEQAVIKMKFIEDLENSEISAMLKKTEGSIRVIQHRAIDKLKRLIDKRNLK